MTPLPSRESGAEGGFVRAFRAEMATAQHQALVETYTWANRMSFGADPGLAERAEEWAARIEEAGKASAVLEALARATICPECGR